MRVIDVLISDIIVPPRRREDFGNIQELADNISARKLLHPITVVVDGEKYKLAAGERRLRAYQLLGETEIPCRLFGELSEDERLLIELEENLFRKDLTTLERSKNLTALVDTATKVIEKEFSGASRKNSKRGRAEGRLTKPVTDEKIAERVGVDRKTISNAKQHVAAVKKYPELATIIPTQKDTITVAKNLDALSEDKRTEARSKLISHDQSTLAVLAEKPPMPKPKARTNGSPSDKWRGVIQDIRQSFSSIKQNGGVLSLTGAWTQSQTLNFLNDLTDFRADLDTFIQELEEQVDELKQQVG